MNAEMSEKAMKGRRTIADECEVSMSCILFERDRGGVVDNDAVRQLDIRRPSRR